MGFMGDSINGSRSLAAAAALMVAVRQVVMRHATRTTDPFGSSGLAVWMCRFLNGALAKVGLETASNTYEAFHGPNKHLDPDRQYMICWHPHGALTLCFAGIGTEFAARSFDDDAPGPRKWFGALASILFNIPVIGEWLMLCGGRPITPENLQKILEKGHSVGMAPGGISEQVRTDHSREQLFFPPNLGFVRQALTHGVALLPVYIFGENQAFTTSEWGRKATNKLYEITGLPIPLVNPVPNKLKMHLMWGHMVEVGRPTPPSEQTDEFVRKVFADYVKALVRCFNDHKDACLPAEAAPNGLTLIWRGHSKEEFESLLAEVHGGELPEGLHVKTGVAAVGTPAQIRSKL